MLFSKWSPPEVCAECSLVVNYVKNLFGDVSIGG